ncbi:MAG: PIG-L family deacetylase [Bacteroidetes bacterium]|nr:PIG-L family deacetylase [Bacteroidota bacterium]
MSLITRLSIHLNRLLLARAEKGPYRILLKNLEKTPFINLASKVLSTEYFKDQLQPLALPVNRFKDILVIAPHQDDETIGCGGTLLLTKNHCENLHIVYITDGGLINFPGGIEESIKVRYLEAEKVCEELSATMHRMDISNHVPEPKKEHLEELAKIIQEVKPQVVFVPWLLDFPPKHRLSNHILLKTDQLFDLPDFEIWGYQVHNMLIPNGYVDITSVIKDKSKLLDYYSSQNNLYADHSHMTQGMNAWNSRFLPDHKANGNPKFAEIFFTLPKNEYLRLVKKFYLPSLTDTYGSDLKVLQAVQQMISI